MKKLYEKSEMTLTLLLIAVYVLCKPAAQSINKAIGIEYAAEALLLIALTAVLAAFIVKTACRRNTGCARQTCPRGNFCDFFHWRSSFRATFGLGRLKT